MSTVPSATDQKLRDLVSQGAARNIDNVTISDPTQGVLQPEGMTMAAEEEIEVLLELADPADTGDEQAAITRLVTILDEATR